MALSSSSRFTLYLTVFLSCVSFAIVLPSLWPYLRQLGANKSFLAFVVAIYSVGEAVGAVYFGCLFSCLPTTQVLQQASLLGTLGSLLYLFAYDQHAFGKYMLLVSRLLCGLWTGGAQAVQQAYLNACLRSADITAATVELNTWACLGFVAGPALALLFVPFPEMHFGVFHFDQLTLPAWFMLVSSVACTLLYRYGLTEERDRRHGAQQQMHHTGELHETSPLLPLSKQLVEQQQAYRNPNFSLLLALLICNIAFFVHMFGFALQETITTPLVQTYYKWSIAAADTLFTGASLATLITLLALRQLSTYVTDRMLTAISLTLGLFGWAFLAPSTLPVHNFIFGFGLASIAFPLGRACIMSLVTKLLPEKWQGRGQGVLLAVGASARILAPFGAVLVFYVPKGSWMVFGGTAALFGASLATVAAAWNSLRTM